MNEKKITGPSKQLRERMEQLRQMPPPTLEEVERQFRASEAIPEKYKDKGPRFKNGPTKGSVL